MHQSCGGMSGDGSQSYAATVISAAKVMSRDIRTTVDLKGFLLYTLKSGERTNVRGT